MNQDHNQTDSGRPKWCAWAWCTFGLWLVSGAALLVVFWVYVPAGLGAFEALEVELPALTVLFLQVGMKLRSIVGLGAVAGAFLLSVLAFILGARGPRAAKVYGALSVATLLTTAGCWFSVVHPLSNLQDRLPAAEFPSPR